ncbi:hypothetical protein SIN8267_01920 [Sinobacterium norvegicum]|uniref:VanZ-like domain-containing protein n=1 Tax=Sinobacterium norvegicum TaxID=1641715 RepID=A0ABM9AF29_9GAMM|nr:VanZ family protein [Sinobacterium norvegicum]CAH0991805.1 hypothetical protein SIN8267_01920 [Sinobacterium norvegicum]
MDKKITTCATLLFALFIILLSLTPVNSHTVESWDKVFHIILYAFFTALSYPLANNVKQFYWLCFAVFIFGGTIEFAQSFIPGRVMSAYDLLANTIGIMLIIMITRKRWLA